MLVEFEEWKKSAEPFTVAPGKSTEVEGLFSALRLDRKTLPEGLYAYDIRHTDSGAFCTIEEHVSANHMGTFVTEKKIEFPKGKNYKCLTCGYSFG